MRNIICMVLSFLKYILFIFAFGLVFYSIIKTYGRLEKPLSDAISVFIPFAFVLLTFLISLISRSKYVSRSVLFNLVAVLLFVVTIIICLRSIVDDNMILFYRYGIDYNPAFLSDNLSAIEAMLYMIGGANVILLLCGLLDRKANYNNNSTRVSKKEHHEKSTCIKEKSDKEKKGVGEENFGDKEDNNKKKDPDDD